MEFIRPDLTIHAANRAILTFHADGRVTADPDLTADKAARAIIALLVNNGWLKYAPDAAPSPDRTVNGGLRESGEYPGVTG
jgi:hypothetical protein